MGRKRRRSVFLGVVGVMLAGAVTGGAQQVEQVTSPYQGEFDYQIGAELEPRVSVDGVLIDLVRISPREAGAAPDEGSVEVEVGWTLTNSGPRTARVLLVLLLEDDQGNALERIELPVVRVGSGKTKTEEARREIRPRALTETRQVYLFLELQ